MTHDGHGSDPADRTGGVLAGTLHVLARHRRPLQGFTLRVSALTAVLGCATVAGGFAVTWSTFEAVRQYADENIANEDSYVAYADISEAALGVPGVVVSLILLLLALLVVSVLHAAYAVGFAHAASGEAPLSTGELWRRTRKRLGAAIAVNALTGLVVGAVVQAGAVVFTLSEGGAIPGVERTGIGETASTQYTLVGWVLPFTIWFLALLLYFRLATATAATVVDGVPPARALYRSWVLTRRARWRTLSLGTAVSAVTLLVYGLCFWAAGALTHPVGLGMLWLSDDNVWITGVLVLILPSAVALLLIPPLALPLVCGTFARLHGELREPRSGGHGSDGAHMERSATRPAL